jgi:hypothetical protein
MNSFSQQFSGEIRAHIAKQQIPASVLEKLLGISKAHTYRLLKGDAEWSLEEAAKTAEWAGISLDTFLTPLGKAIA